MPIDFTKLGTPKSLTRPTDPIDLFHSLRVTDTAVNDLWLAQGDALREWNSHRAEEDVAIVLNTGAGKTLIGLLAAQSLVNETAGRVVYACSSVQLVKQTERKAEGYGLKVTTYSERTFSNDLFQQGLAPCVTTYQALFNGISRFFREDLESVVFDDSHTAGHILRDQFTLSIKRASWIALFDQLVQLYRPYFTRIHQGVGYDETYDRADAGTARFVPPFAVRHELGELQRLLGDAKLDESIETMFSWRHLHDHLDQCAVFVSGTEFTFTPPVIPVRGLPYFRQGVRRLYLSATLAAEDDFLRTFGRIPTRTITPSTAAGECERLILVPAQINPNGPRVEDIAIAKPTIVDTKALVLVPTWRRAEIWEDVATNFPGDFDAKIEAFKEAQGPACLVVPARYDGVDLPGDTCRVLVVDDLPTGMNPLERYMWERLNLAKILRSAIASRVVQSLGRISRGMSDHGVVIITGGKLVDWLLTPRNQALLPDFIRRQFMLGLHVSRDARTPDDFATVLEQCLNREEGWLQYYKGTMSEIELGQVDTTQESQDALRMSQAESSFGHAFWERDYRAAAAALERDLEWTLGASRATGAWHLLWLGACYEALGETEGARDSFERAHSASKEIPPLDLVEYGDDDVYSSQVMAVAASLRKGIQADLSMPRRFGGELASLDGGGTVRQTERSLELLGTYLGFETTRPDNELGTGPDILWIAPDGSALNLEAKTDKRSTSVYTKEDLGQLRDHLRWTHDQRGEIQVRSIFVGPIIPASSESNPDPDMLVIELTAFADLRDRLQAALVDICASATPVNVVQSTYQVLQERKLLWPTVYEELPKHRLADA